MAVNGPSTLPGGVMTKSKGESSTYRFEIELKDEDDYEISYLDLIEKNEKVLNGTIDVNLVKSSQTENQAKSELTNVVGDFVKQFDKYGPSVILKKGTKKRRLQVKDFCDMGFGYDQNDPFIDDTESYECVIPPDVQAQEGGFYVNKGGIKTVVDNTSDIETWVIGGAKQIISSSEEESDVPKLQKPHFPNAGKPKKRSKQLVSKAVRQLSKPKPTTERQEEASVDKPNAVVPPVLPSDNSQEKVKKSESGQDIQKKRPYNRNSVGGAKKRPRSPNSTSKPVVKKRVIVTNGMDSADDFQSKPSEGSKPIMVANSEQPTVEEVEIISGPSSQTNNSDECSIGSPASSTGVSPQKDDGTKEPPALLATVSDTIRQTVEKLKAEAKRVEFDIKRFFHSGTDETLIRLDGQLRGAPASIRTNVISHISGCIPGSRKSFLRRIRKVKEEYEDRKVSAVLEQLKQVIINLTPEAMKRYETELKGYQERMAAWKTAFDEYERQKSAALAQAAAAAAATDAADGQKTGSDNQSDSNPQQTPDVGQAPRKPNQPRRIFQPNEQMRTLITRIVLLRLQSFDNLGVKGISEEEYLKKFLEERVAPLWPKGWVTMAFLLKSSRNGVEKFKQWRVAIKQNSVSKIEKSDTPPPPPPNLASSDSSASPLKQVSEAKDSSVVGKVPEKPSAKRSGRPPLSACQRNSGDTLSDPKSSSCVLSVGLKQCANSTVPVPKPVPVRNPKLSVSSKQKISSILKSVDTQDAQHSNSQGLPTQLRQEQHKQQQKPQQSLQLPQQSSQQSEDLDVRQREQLQQYFQQLSQQYQQQQLIRQQMKQQKMIEKQKQKQLSKQQAKKQKDLLKQQNQNRNSLFDTLSDLKKQDSHRPLTISTETSKSESVVSPRLSPAAASTSLALILEEALSNSGNNKDTHERTSPFAQGSHSPRGHQYESSRRSSGSESGVSPRTSFHSPSSQRSSSQQHQVSTPQSSQEPNAQKWQSEALHNLHHRRPSLEQQMQEEQKQHELLLQKQQLEQERIQQYHEQQRKDQLMKKEQIVQQKRDSQLLQEHDDGAHLKSFSQSMSVHNLLGEKVKEQKEQTYHEHHRIHHQVQHHQEQRIQMLQKQLLQEKLLMEHKEAAQQESHDKTKGLQDKHQELGVKSKEEKQLKIMAQEVEPKQTFQQHQKEILVKSEEERQRIVQHQQEPLKQAQETEQQRIQLHQQEQLKHAQEAEQHRLQLLQQEQLKQAQEADQHRLQLLQQEQLKQAQEVDQQRLHLQQQEQLKQTQEAEQQQQRLQLHQQEHLKQAHEAEQQRLQLHQQEQLKQAQEVEQRIMQEQLLKAQEEEQQKIQQDMIEQKRQQLLLHLQQKQEEQIQKKRQQYLEEQRRKEEEARRVHQEMLRQQQELQRKQQEEQMKKQEHQELLRKQEEQLIKFQRQEEIRKQQEYHQELLKQQQQLQQQQIQQQQQQEEALRKQQEQIRQQQIQMIQQQQEQARKQKLQQEEDHRKKQLEMQSQHMQQLHRRQSQLLSPGHAPSERPIGHVLGQPQTSAISDLLMGGVVDAGFSNLNTSELDNYLQGKAGLHKSPKVGTVSQQHPMKMTMPTPILPHLQQQSQSAGYLPESPSPHTGWPTYPGLHGAVASTDMNPYANPVHHPIVSSANPTSPSPVFPLFHTTSPSGLSSSSHYTQGHHPNSQVP